MPTRPLLALLLLAACDPETPAGKDPVDSGEPGDTADPDDTGTAAPDLCTELGLTSRPWDAGGTTGDFDTVAPDLAIATLDGDLVLSEAWSGCDVVLFVNYYPSADWPIDLGRAADVEDLLLGAPKNARFVFSSLGEDPVAEMTALKEVVDNGLGKLDDAALAEHWAGRIHFATTNAFDDGWIGDLNQRYYVAGDNGFVLWSWAIDRFQVVRETGYFADPATGWQQWPATFANYELERFNVEAERQDRLDAETDVDVLRVWDGVEAGDPGWAGVSLYGDLELPADMSAYDTMEFDLTLACTGHPEMTSCPEWDYLVYLYLCDEDDPATTDVDESETCSTEIGRWITTYARAGRWVHDVTPFLAQLQGGGTRRVRFYTTQTYLVTLDVRLRNAGRGVRPVAMEWLWSGGSFDANYNVGREAVAFVPPADVARVDVVALTTGHGFGQDRENCAEFCNHQHAFTVNGAETWTQEFPEAGSAYGCAEQVAQQTVPNQYGTWVYGRGGWCPGKQVDVWSADVTSAVEVGAENVVEYRGLFEGQEYAPEPLDSGSGFGARIDLASWLVYYE